LSNVVGVGERQQQAGVFGFFRRQPVVALVEAARAFAHQAQAMAIDAGELLLAAQQREAVVDVGTVRMRQQVALGITDCP